MSKISAKLKPKRKAALVEPPEPGTRALTTGLISHWKMDQSSGSRTDSHGTNLLTQVGSVLSGTGKFSICANFEAGDAAWLSRASNATLQCGNIDWTFAAWLQLESKVTSGTILAKDNDTAGNREFNFLYSQTVDRWAIRMFKATDVAAVANADNFGVVPLATWCFVVAWHDSVNDTINIQVNNGAVNSVPTGGPAQAAGSAEFRVGNTGRSVPSYFDGLIDSLSFWKRTLSAYERTALYNGGNGLDYEAFASVEEPSGTGGANLKNRLGLRVLGL